MLNLVLLGATGDLAGRLLLPALARLLAAGEVDDLVVVGAAPQDLDDAGFAHHVAQRLDEHAPDVPAAARRALVERLRWARVDLDDAASVAAAVSAAGRDAPVAVYLALPPWAFAPAIAALAAAPLPAGSRVVVEKPFGADAASAAALNADLERLTGGVQGAVFRVDHALALPGVADMLALRGPGGDLAAIWHGGAVEQVDVVWEETIALEGRADFFDRAGMLRDVAQNHLLQLLAVAACRWPEDPADDAAWRAARLDLLRSLLPADDAPQRWTRRARYTAGRLAAADGAPAREVPDYAAEDGVDPARGTETYVELVYVSTDPRWAGTRFVLRAGKALGADRKAVVVHLRDDAPAVAGEMPGRRVRVDLDGRSETGERVDGQVSAYARVLTEVLAGGSGLSVSAAGSEQAWRVVAPALAAWAGGAVPLLEHPAGSGGPARLAL